MCIVALVGPEIDCLISQYACTLRPSLTIPLEHTSHDIEGYCTPSWGCPPHVRGPGAPISVLNLCAHTVCAVIPVQAAGLGGGGRRLLNTANSCGICGNEMKDYSHLGEAEVCANASTFTGVDLY